MGKVQGRISNAILARIRQRRGAIPVSGDSNSYSGEVKPAKLREARFSDFAGVAKLKERTGIVADSSENWERLWRRNPALNDANSDRPIGWVLDADGEIVGFFGNIALQCRYGDRTLRAVSAHGFAVDRPYRALAVSLAAAFYRQPGIDLFLSTSAIEASGKIAAAFKSSKLPQPDYDTVLFWVLRPYPFSQVLMKKLSADSLLSPIGSRAGAFAIGADNVFRQRFPKGSRSPLMVSEISLAAIGSDFERLFAEKLKERVRLYADRTAETLRWHFEIPGDKGSVRVLCCRKNGELEGYAIVRTDTGEEDGLRKSIIADLVAKYDDPDVVTALCVAAYKGAKATGSDVLEMQGFPANIRQLAMKWRPYQRKYPACPYYYKASDPELHKALSDAAAWYACPFDGDTTLIRPSYPNTVNVAPEQSVAIERDSRNVVRETEQTQVL